MKELWEILVPTLMGDTQKPVRLRHHRQWDHFVRSRAGGLTILKPAKGQWISQTDDLYEERVIPVRIACSRKDILEICEFTLGHYRQLTVMAYRVSDEVIFMDKKPAP